MKRLFLATLIYMAGCVASNYTGALQNCVDTHVGDPVGREQCLCDVAQDAGRPCSFLDAGAQDGSPDGGAE